MGLTTTNVLHPLLQRDMFASLKMSRESFRRNHYSNNYLALSMEPSFLFVYRNQQEILGRINNGFGENEVS